MRVLTPLLIVGVLAGCAPDPSMPTSPLQWERRQQAIERREAERKAYCAEPARAADPSCTARPGVQP